MCVFLKYHMSTLTTLTNTALSALQYSYAQRLLPALQIYTACQSVVRRLPLGFPVFVQPTSVACPFSSTPLLGHTSIVLGGQPSGNLPP